MKTYSIRLGQIIVFLLFLVRIQAQENTSSKLNLSEFKDFLRINGRLDKTTKNLAGVYTVNLILDNKVIETKTLNTSKGFSFKLERDNIYAIRIEKEGFIAKTVSISTKVPKNLSEDETYIFDISTSLLSADLVGLLTDDDIDFPAALINFNKGADCFELNKKYTENLQQKMKKNLLAGL